MNWWSFGKEPAAKDGPPTLLDEIEKRGKQYLEDIDNGKLVYPACKRTDSDAACEESAVGDHTRLEAFRYLLAVPRREFTLLADPDAQVAVLDGYLRQLPHDETVIEFTGSTHADLAIAVIAGFNWLNHCAILAGADRKQFLGTLRNFRKIASSAQKWWMTDGARERYLEMVQAQQEPPLFFNLIWTDYTRLATEIAATRAARGTGHG
jgi:hypothetical protein